MFHLLSEKVGYSFSHIHNAIAMLFGFIHFNDKLVFCRFNRRANIFSKLAEIERF